MKKKLVIFDLDGTLLNTIEDLGNAANYALHKNGYATHSMASYPFFVGNGVRRLIERVLPEDRRDIETVERLLKDFKEYYNEHLTDCTKPYPGIEDMLLGLRAKGVKVAVASNKYQAAAERIVAHYYGNVDFAAVEGQKEGVKTKPDPSIVFGILAKTKVAKADVLYVGDSGVDMETARRACVDSVGVTWGFRPEKELIEYHAGTIVNSPDQILNLVETGLPLG
ncbi:MAG: HAD family hydrolase [Sodaliphilus pleomorphus]|uniref:HAD family hydrolase n=1 Tax=Sodaliphilus pleomorphus TaxID=2606626 RepID=UPI0023F1E342|nr:HAD family hydrolase [Sodaliphilus pleomorphus]MDD7065536.1 HAD family hydrolase [Sodaliphilus pleomorphus]MDY2831806.1 HAD family hydrolase [Sodaliphilus pleomorphus]